MKKNVEATEVVAMVVEDSKADANLMPTIPEGNLLDTINLGNYYSMPMVTVADKIKIYNAINTPDDTIAENINKVIVMKDVLIENIMLINDETGFEEVAPRMIIIDVNGKTYSTVSHGMLGAIQRIKNLFGKPTWEDGIGVVVLQKPTKNGSMLTLELVE